MAQYDINMGVYYSARAISNRAIDVRGLVGAENEVVARESGTSTLCSVHFVENTDKPYQHIAYCCAPIFRLNPKYSL